MASPSSASAPPDPNGVRLDRTSTDTVRRCLVAGAMVLTPVLLVLGSILEVDTGDDSGAASLALIAPDRGQFYAAGLLLAVGLAMLPACAIGLMQLTRDRGGVLGTVGGSLLFVGGAAAGAGIFMYTAVLYVGSSPALDREAIGAFDEAAEDSFALGVPFLIGFVGIALGMLLLGIALWRARTVPRWVAVVVGLAGVASWFTGSKASAILATSAFFVLVACAVELVRPQGRTIVLPGVPGQSRGGHDVASPTSSAV